MNKFFAAFLLPFAFAAAAQDRNPYIISDGNQFLASKDVFDRFSRGEQVDQATASAFVSFVYGVVQVNIAVSKLTAAKSEPYPTYVACIPTKVTVRQAANIIEKFLREMPETNHFAIGLTSQEALSRAFPCK